MKPKNAITLLIIFLFTTTLGYAQADDPIRKYSFNTLAQLWKNLIKPNKSPKAAWYKQALLAHQIAESDSQQRAAIMIRHEIALNMYLNRAAYYEAAPEPKIGENETQWQASVAWMKCRVRPTLGAAEAPLSRGACVAGAHHLVTYV